MCIRDRAQAGLSWLTILRKRENFRRAFDRFDPERLAEPIYRALRLYAHAQPPVLAFNVGILMPPLGERDAAWQGFPVLVHLVDRGSPNVRSSDFGAMEIYGTPVVASDPFELAEQLRDGDRAGEAAAPGE